MNKNDNTVTPGFQQADPARTGYQYLEDLSCAYWYSHVLFASIELALFKAMEAGISQLSPLAEETSSNPDKLHRLLRCLEKMALVIHSDGNWYNSQVVSQYLVPEKESYMGDFFLYRRYMQTNWADLTDSVSRQPRKQDENPDYKERNLRYVRSTDTLIRQKAKEISRILPQSELEGPILDVGGGAGGMVRHLWSNAETREAVLFDLPETIEAARALYGKNEDWKGIRTLEGDFRTHVFNDPFGVIILSNFLHAYSREEAKALLAKSADLLAPGGRLLIHDYFPDRRGDNPQKGAFYDLAMMLNTYNGACHDAGLICRWLEELKIPHIEIRDLETDSTIITAGGRHTIGINPEPYLEFAYDAGFARAVAIDPGSVVTEPWVAQKCRFGCDNFGNNLQCPPYGMDYQKTRVLLDSYSRAILVQGEPPGKAFHEKLLRLERSAFLDGFHKALVFGAGPCTLCPSCPEDGSCRNHKEARLAMESCGIDVYTTAHNAGLSLKPLKGDNWFVKYIGLLLLE